MVVLTNLHPTDFPADGLGKLIYKLDDTRIFVRGSDMLHVVLQLFDKGIACLTLIVAGKDNGCLYHLPADFIGHTGDGAFHYGRMGHQGAFHLKGADAVTGTLDDIVGTAYKPKVTVFIFPSNIARVIDTVVPCLAARVP